MNENYNSTRPEFYIIIEENNSHTEREISAFDSSTPFAQIEKLANCLFQYYEYMGFTGNKKGALLLDDWKDYKFGNNLTFNVATSGSPIFLPGTNGNSQTMTADLTAALSLRTGISMSELKKSKINFYAGLNDFFERNPIRHLHGLSELGGTQAPTTLRPIFDLMGHENYLINAQGTFNNPKLKQDFGRIIMTNPTDAKRICVAVTQYYLINNIDAGVVMRPISSFHALDMVLGKVPDFENTRYYNNTDEFLANAEFPDFQFLQNDQLEKLGYLDISDFTENLEKSALHYYEPVVGLSGHDNTSRLVSFKDEHETAKYLKAYLVAVARQNLQDYVAKIQDIAIYGNANGMDLHRIFVGNMVFDDISNYIDFVDSSKRKQPLDMDSTTFDRLKPHLMASMFGE